MPAKPNKNEESSEVAHKPLVKRMVQDHPDGIFRQEEPHKPGLRVTQNKNQVSDGEGKHVPMKKINTPAGHGNIFSGEGPSTDKANKSVSSQKHASAFSGSGATVADGAARTDVEYQEKYGRNLPTPKNDGAFEQKNSAKHHANESTMNRNLCSRDDSKPVNNVKVNPDRSAVRPAPFATDY